MSYLNLKFYSPYDNHQIPNCLFKKLDNDVNFLCDIIKQAYALKEKLEKGSATNLLWLWCPKFESIPAFDKWYADIIEKLDDEPAKYFQKYLGTKLFRRNSDKSVVWLNDSVLRVINDSSKMTSAYSNAVRGIGDFDDLCLGFHGEDFYNYLKSEAPFWKAKAEEVDNFGYYKFATALRLMADDMENPNF